MRWRWLAVPLAVLAVLATFSGAASTRPGIPVAGSIHLLTGQAVSAQTVTPPPIQHVITVVMENANVTAALSQGPFEKYLASKYSFASQYYGVCHPSASNYLSMTSGNSWQCGPNGGSDAYNVYSTINVADLLEATGHSWAAYMENMPTACGTTDMGPYVVHHNPFVYYSDIVNNASRCAAHVLPLSAFGPAVATGALPNYAFISPNITNDGTKNVTIGDNWLKGWLSPLINDSFFASSVVFITYDEATGDRTGFNGTLGGHVFFAAVSPFVKPSYTYVSDATHYNLLSTTEWLLGLGSTGRNDSAAFGPMTGLFNVSTVTGPNTFPLTGRVISGGTGAILPAATVLIPNLDTTITNSSGGYVFSLANGTYTITATAAGYTTSSIVVTIQGLPAHVDFFLKAGGPRALTLPLWDWLGAVVAAGAAIIVGLYFGVRTPARAISPPTPKSDSRSAGSPPRPPPR